PKHGKLDYVCGWYEKAANFISKTTITVSFVSTDSITQGEQVGILWKHLIQEHRIKIIFAYRTFPWSSEASNNANVNCVIIGFSCDKTYNNEYIIFDNKEKYIASHINGYLLDMPDVYIQSRRKKSLQDVPQIIQGNKPIDGGNLILSEKEKQDLINRYPSLKNVIKLYIGSKELIKNKKRYCLWLNGVEPSVYSGIPEIRKRLQGVIDTRKNSPTKVVRENATATPAIFSQIRQPQTSYLAIPEVSGCTRKYIPIDFLDPNIIASNKLYLIPTTSIYLFGIIESIVHMTWMRMTAGRKGISYSYSLAVYTNFPFPELDDKQRKVISKTAQSILDARRLYPNSSLADLYDPLTMPKELQDAHKANDKVILKVYGLSVNSSESEILQKLFAMYEELTSKGNK
ncbi:methylase, partial [Lactobacillus salivarius]|nr:methylase [Ligilactobacillus salivarius]